MRLAVSRRRAYTNISDAIPDTVACTRSRHSKADLRVTPHSSAAHSTGTLRRMCLMKKTQVASGLRQCSRTVPVREVNLLPQQRQPHLGTPAPKPGHSKTCR